MSASEEDVQGWIQDKLAAITGTFVSGTVLVNDWSLRDMASELGPRVIIANADDFGIDMTSIERFWRCVVPIVLLVPFRDWNETSVSFRDARQAILDSFMIDRKVGDEGAWAEFVVNGGVITEVYDPYTPAEMIHESLPIFVSQQINVGVVCP